MQNISARELEQLHDETDAEIKKSGLPTEEQLKAEIEELNKTAPVKEQKKVRILHGLRDGGVFGDLLGFSVGLLFGFFLD